MSNPLPGYRITERIDIGARSKISIAVELDTGKVFALKHVVRRSAEDDPFLQQVENEYAVSGKLEDEYLRRSLFLHRVRQRLTVSELFLLMEYIDGLNLEKARPNRLRTFLRIFQMVARGLDALHEAGFVHADIKPNNIMLVRRGGLKIIDFGQACPIGHRKARIQGTPDYIAPEQVRRLPLDQRTDVFNVGATMYWVLTSRTFTTALSGGQKREGSHVINPVRPVAPIELNDKIPLSLSRLVMDCCRENPAERPADMKQLLSRLAVVERLWARHRESLRARRERDGARKQDPAEGMIGENP